MKLTEAVKARIVAWRSAYEAANGGTAPVVDYECGWYYVGGKESILAVRWRASKVDQAIERLERRAALEESNG